MGGGGGRGMHRSMGRRRCWARLGVIRGWRGLTRFSLFKQVGEILLCCAHALADFNQNTLVEFQLIAILYLIRRSPMVIPNVVAGLIIDHHAFVEGIITKVAILPSFGLAAHIVGV